LRELAVVVGSAPVRSGLEFDLGLSPATTMEPAFHDGLPGDVLIVEDDPLIALDFEDTILGFGVKTVRTAATVARALQMIADRAPDFALLDVGLLHENSFAIAERLDALAIPYVFVTGYSAVGMFPAAFAHKPTLPKPYSSHALQALLMRRLDGGAAS
jgi:CheY-like chemotaxis protein